jgi:hypothetical protein
MSLLTLMQLIRPLAGAGNVWSYTTKGGEVVRRSEGLAVASLDMFLAGLFSEDPNTPHQVTGMLSGSLGFLPRSV